MRTIEILILAATLAVAGQAAAAESPVRHGEYLVKAIGGCNDCHSPRDRRGMLIPGKELTGAPLAFAPTAPMPWAPIAPPIRGLPKGWSEAQTTKFLETGVRPNGSPPRPPMPEFRLHREDARAIAAYLASLK